MDLQLNAKDRVRLSTNNHKSGMANFIDASCLEFELGLMVTNWSNTYQYIEVRKKWNQLAVFYFLKKSDKKNANLEGWEDAEVVFSINEVKHK